MDISVVTVVVIWFASFLHSPSGTCIVPIIKKQAIPQGISDDDLRDLTRNCLDQLHQRVQRVKDIAYTSLLVTIGGLATLSFLLLGDLITLGRPDIALEVSLSAFAVTLPLLAATYLNLRIWRAMPVPEAAVRTASSVCSCSIRLPYMQLLTIVPVIVTTLVGVVSVLWHVFWIAGVAFIVAALLCCGFIIGSSVQHYRVYLSAGKLFAEKGASACRAAADKPPVTEPGLENGLPGAQN